VGIGGEPPARALAGPAAAIVAKTRMPNTGVALLSAVRINALRLMENLPFAWSLRLE